MTIFRALGSAAVACTLLPVLSARADHTDTFVDSTEPYIDLAADALTIGGQSRQQIAQNFRPTQDATLIAVEVPAACDRGVPLEIDIRAAQQGGQPESVPLAAELHRNPPERANGFVRYPFSSPIDVRARESYFLVIAAPTSTGDDARCRILQAPGGDYYPDGDAYFRTHLDDYWQRFIDPADIPFKTILRTGADLALAIVGREAPARDRRIYTLRIDNLGSLTATAITVSTNVSRFATLTPPQGWDCVIDIFGTTTCALRGSISSGGSVFLTLDVTFAAPGAYPWGASARAHERDRDSTNNTTVEIAVVEP